jgi:hypothetical protein
VKYLKKFENLKSEPKIGDYALFKDSTTISKQNIQYNSKIKFDTFISENAGQIIGLKYKTDFKYIVKYKNPPLDTIEYAFIGKNDILNLINDDIKIDFEYKGRTNITSFTTDELIYFSENKEEVELYAQLIKYNL